MKNKFTKLQEQVFIGTMLGDAYLSRGETKNSNSYMRIERSIKDRKYLLWQMILFGCFMQKPEITKSDGTFYFRTRSTKIFTMQRKKWYPKGVKIVPKDIKLTPLIIAIWLCDDGCISCGYPTDYGSYTLNCEFATQSFTEKEVKFLQQELERVVGAKFRIAKRQSKATDLYQYTICGSTNTTKALISVIKKHIPKSMHRKLNAYYTYIQDMPKDHTFSGESHRLAKLNMTKARTIRELFRNGKTITEISKRYNVSLATIRQVINNITWKE